MHNSHGLCKHPNSERHLSYTNLNYWLDMGELFEHRMFDAIFFCIAGVYDVDDVNSTI